MDGVSKNIENYRSAIMSAPTGTIATAMAKTYSYLIKYYNIGVSISGGADSDDMLDMIERIRPRYGVYAEGFKITYVFFDTGVEMGATKKHLDYLEEKYGVVIERRKAKIPVAAAVRKYGYPFLSKKTSDYIYRLQQHGFRWEDKPFNELYLEYPNCKAALRWWCNSWKDGQHKPMQSEIASEPFLKEFMIENPPDFIISPKCCDYAKKATADGVRKEMGFDIQFIGVRKAEGGARSTAYTACFVDGKHGPQHFPLFWWTNSDKEAYEKAYGVVHSDAYTKYGCPRTGCAGCPFTSHFEQELKMLDAWEPKLGGAVKNIFSPSYEYTRKYLAYRKAKKEEMKKGGSQE